ncbi:unnamed protein product [Lampetra planeri]
MLLRGEQHVAAIGYNPFGAVDYLGKHSPYARVAGVSIQDKAQREVRVTQGRRVSKKIPKLEKCFLLLLAPTTFVALSR